MSLAADKLPLTTVGSNPDRQKKLETIKNINLTITIKT
jgi:hypothetical protein